LLPLRISGVHSGTLEPAPDDKMLARVDAIDADIAELDERIEQMIAPFGHLVEQLDEIPGIGRTAAAVSLRRSPPAPRPQDEAGGRQLAGARKSPAQMSDVTGRVELLACSGPR
jgi:transposase